jgi:hypothetical protein
LKPALYEEDGDIKFATGKPIALNVWDGYHSETGNKKSISRGHLWLDELGLIIFRCCDIKRLIARL